VPVLLNTFVLFTGLKDFVVGGPPDIPPLPPIVVPWGGTDFLLIGKGQAKELGLHGSTQFTFVILLYFLKYLLY
jgi:hypothetical protein